MTRVAMTPRSCSPSRCSPIVRCSQLHCTDREEVNVVKRSRQETQERLREVLGRGVDRSKADIDSIVEAVLEAKKEQEEADLFRAENLWHNGARGLLSLLAVGVAAGLAICTTF